MLKRITVSFFLLYAVENVRKICLRVVIYLIILYSHILLLDYLHYIYNKNIIIMLAFFCLILFIKKTAHLNDIFNQTISLLNLPSEYALMNVCLVM